MPTSQETSPERAALRARLAIAAIVALAAVERLASLGRESLWLDESYTFRAISGSVKQLFLQLSTEDHPPGYFLLLRFLTGFLGTSEWALRFPSALAGIASVALVAWIGWRLFSPRAAVIAAALECASVMQLSASQEARPYSFLHLFSILSFYCAYVLVTKPRIRTFALYVLCGVALIYTHYFGVFVLIAESAGVLVLALRGRVAGRFWLAWCAAQALILVSFAAWMPTFLARLHEHRHIHSPTTSAAEIGQVLSALFNSSATLAVLILVVAGQVVAWLFRRRTTPACVTIDAADRDAFVLVLTWGGVTVLGPLVTSLALTPVFLPRYLIMALFPLYLALGAWFSVGGRWKWLCAAALPAALPIWLYYAGIHKEPWRDLEAVLAARRTVGEKTYSPGQSCGVPLHYYGDEVGVIEASDPRAPICDTTYWFVHRGDYPLSLNQSEPIETHDFHADGNRTFPWGQPVSVLLRYPDSPGGTPLGLIRFKRSPACGP